MSSYRNSGPERHAIFGGSNYHWINYTPERMLEVYENSQAAERGTELHAYAQKAIELGIKQSRSKKTLNLYINDAIQFKMNPEVEVYYSPFFFGTADALSFDPFARVLRIHDLKTGTTPAHMEQLGVYAAFFYLQHSFNPNDYTTILRIYQNDDIAELIPDSQMIIDIMNTAVSFNEMLAYKYGDNQNGNLY